MNPEIDDQMLLLSQYYTNDHIYSQFVPAEQDIVAAASTKPRRRRKKNNGGDGGGGTKRKRKLSEEQVNMLEKSFGNEHKLDSERKDRLAAELRLDPRQVAVWFQNRRARWRSKNLEDEYSKLKSLQETAIVEKCNLETQLLKLKEQLDEAEKEIQRLTERLDGFSSNSPASSSFSMDHIDPLFFGVENVIYMQDHNNYVNGLEWDNYLYIM